MKKRLVLSLLMFAVSFSIGGCGLISRKGNETETSTVESTESEANVVDSTEDDFYEEDLSPDDAGDPETSDTDLGDKSVGAAASPATGSLYHLGDAVPVLFSENGKNHSGTATINSFVTAEAAQSIVDQFNLSHDDQIDTLAEDLEYGVLTYRFSLLDSDVIAPIDSKLKCKVVGISETGEAEQLKYGDKVYETGNVYYTEAADVAFGSEVINTVIFAVPKGCTSFGIVLGDGTSIISY